MARRKSVNPLIGCLLPLILFGGCVSMCAPNKPTTTPPAPPAPMVRLSPEEERAHARAMAEKAKRDSAEAAAYQRQQAQSQADAQALARLEALRGQVNQAASPPSSNYYAPPASSYVPAASSGGSPYISSGGDVSVRGYRRKDGTLVRPHTRSRPGSGKRKGH
jgi:hypothetical protein